MSLVYHNGRIVDGAIGVDPRERGLLLGDGLFETMLVVKGEALWRNLHLARMEGGDLSLEQSLEAHRRGLELAQFCQGLLAQAQQQVKVLEADLLKPFDSGSEAN